MINNVLNLETKLKLLARTEIGNKYGLHKSTVTKIVKKRDQIEGASSSNSFQPERKHMRSGKAEDVDEILY